MCACAAAVFAFEVAMLFARKSMSATLDMHIITALVSPFIPILEGLETLRAGRLGHGNMLSMKGG